MLEEWNSLKDDWNDLVFEHDELVNDWDILEKDWELLVATNSELRKYEYNWNTFCEDELIYQETLSIYSLKSFLTDDRTDKIAYSDNFRCRHYALMLSLKGKTRDYRLGVITVQGNYTAGGEYFHAFNAVRTDKGVVYIEPQIDETWSYKNHVEIRGGTIWLIDNVTVNVTSVEIIVDY